MCDSHVFGAAHGPHFMQTLIEHDISPQSFNIALRTNYVCKLVGGKDILSVGTEFFSAFVLNKEN